MYLEGKPFKLTRNRKVIIIVLILFLAFMFLSLSNFVFSLFRENFNNKCNTALRRGFFFVTTRFSEQCLDCLNTGRSKKKKKKGGGAF